MRAVGGDIVATTYFDRWQIVSSEITVEPSSLLGCMGFVVRSRCDCVDVDSMSSRSAMDTSRLRVATWVDR